MMKKKLVFRITFGLLLLFFTQIIQSQVTLTFISYVGGFRINLPQKVNGAGGNMTAGGVKFIWRESEVEYEIGFFEKLGLPFALKGEDFSFEDCVKKYFNQFSERGEKISEKEISLGIYKGKEYKYKTKENFHILRLYEVDDRIFKLLAQFPLKNEKTEQKVLQVFDSFQLLDKDLVKKELDKKLIEATPKALPQTPIILKLKSDIQDRELKGKVKSVFTSNAYYNLKNIQRKPLPLLYEEFNVNGNLTKTIEYDSYGNPSQIKRYGYVAGKRVANWGTVEYEYDIVGGIALPFPPSIKPDKRFDESYVYKYVNNKLTEEAKFLNVGLRHYKATFQYLNGKKETLYYGSEKLPFSKVEEFFDEKGNVTKLLFSEKQETKFEITGSYIYKYENFDDQGNWIKRIVLKDYGFGTTTNFVPAYLEQREIFYY